MSKRSGHIIVVPDPVIDEFAQAPVSIKPVAEHPPDVEYLSDKGFHLSIQ
jgi:hypothetical protein